MLWYGQLTTRRTLLLRGFAFSSIPALWLTLLLVAPTLVLAVVAFAQRSALGGDIDWTFSLRNFWSLLGYSSFGWSSAMLRIIGMSRAATAAVSATAEPEMLATTAAVMMAT